MSRHILIVDDDRAILFSLAFIFRKSGYQITQARDGREALSLALQAEKAKRPFDLLITDIQMPGMSGVELVNEIKIIYDVSLPIIVVSGVQDKGLIRKLLDAGCSGFFLKPFDIDELLRYVEGVLEKTERNAKKELQARLMSRRVV